MRAFVRRYPWQCFLPLAFLLSWYPWALTRLGVEGATPGMNPLGVLVAALIVTGLQGGGSFKALLSRIVRVRAALRWYLIAIFLPIGLVILAVAMNYAIEPGALHSANLPMRDEVIASFIFGFLFVGLGEEPGWRGLLLQELLGKLSWTRAALVVGCFWAAWHVPLLGTQVAPEHTAQFFIGVFAASVVLAWLYRGSGESVFLCMLMHATVNTAGANYAFRLFEGDALTRLWWINSILWTAAAIAVALRKRVSATPAASALPP
jgi:membrane protease YdiL (CAAX protease family)